MNMNPGNARLLLNELNLAIINNPQSVYYNGLSTTTENRDQITYSISSVLQVADVPRLELINFLRKRNAMIIIFKDRNNNILFEKKVAHKRIRSVQDNVNDIRPILDFLTVPGIVTEWFTIVTKLNSFDTNVGINMIHLNTIEDINRIYNLRVENNNFNAIFTPVRMNLNRRAKGSAKVFREIQIWEHLLRNTFNDIRWQVDYLNYLLQNVHHRNVQRYIYNGIPLSIFDINFGIVNQAICNQLETIIRNGRMDNLQNSLTNIRRLLIITRENMNHVCPYCLDRFGVDIDSLNIRILPCQHVYCTTCWNEYVNHHNMNDRRVRCGLCRAIVS